jgi:hypothetical protein
MNNQNTNTTKVITSTIRLSFANIFEPKSINGGAAKYGACLIIPKSDTKTIDAINKAIDAAIEVGGGKWGGKKPPRAALHLPLRDGDALHPDEEEFRNSYFLNANNSRKPGVVDLNCNPILDRTQVYSGCYVRASLNFFAYSNSGNKGVAAGLNNIQFVRDGELLGGRSNPKDDFNDGFSTEDGGDDFLS